MQARDRAYSIKNKKLVRTMTFSLVLLVTVALLISGSVSAMDLQGKQSNMNLNKKSMNRLVKDESPNIHSNLVAPAQSQPNTIWDIQLSFDVTTVSGAAGNAGAEWDGTYFYSTRWASNLIHKYDSSGNLVSEFSIAGVSGLRDLAYDGTYFWGGNGGGTLWKMDFGNQTLVQTFTGAFEVRAIGYNTDLNIIYASGWADPVYEIDPSDGSVLGTFNLVTTISTYGMAYDAATTGGPFLWVFDQTAGGAVIYQWDLATGAYTGITHDVNLDFTNVGVAGGLFVCTDFVPGFATVGGLSQGTPDIMFCYEIEQITQLDHDLGVQSIDSPFSGDAQVFTPEVSVKNYGLNTETSVPVQLTIGTTTIATTVVLDEDFESTFPPTGWTTVLNAGLYGWERNDYWARPNYAGTGYCALADVDSAYSYPMDCELISPSFDLSTTTSAVLEWNNYFYLFASDSCTVDISTDGGATWTNVYTMTGQYLYGVFEHSAIDISAFCGSSNTMIRFQYYAPGWDYYWEVDDVLISSEDITYIGEFDETEYITSIAPGETKTVTYDDWEPADWGTAENVDIDYEVTACQLLADDYSSNDCKDKTVTLHYSFLHDIAVVSVGSPSEDGDAQTLPVECTIKNVGQFPECCYQTKMEIGEEMGSFIDEDFSGVTVPALPSGWNTNYPSNWKTYNTNYAGGTAPELWFYFSPSATDTFRCYTDPMDTTGYTNMNLNFKMYVSHYASPYDLAVETSTDGASWNTVWTIPGQSVPATDMTIPLTTADGLGSSTFRISFTFIGYSWNINEWAIDNIELKAPSIVEEYEEVVCTIELDPGEEATLTFDDWTPDALAAGISGPRKYIAIGTQMLSTDTNPSNDMAFSEFTLDYRHDVGVQDITEPSLGRNPDVFYAFNSYPGDESVWFESTTPGIFNTIGPNTASDFICAGTWADGVWYVSDYGTGSLYTVDPTDGTMTLIGGSLVGGYNGIAYDGSTMYGATSTQLYEIDLSTGAQTLIGSFGIGGELMIDIAIDHDTGICYGHDIVTDSIYTIDLSTGAATLLGLTGLSCNYAQGMEYDQGNDILYLSAYTTQGELYTCDITTGACTLVGAFQSGAEVCGLAIPYSGGGPSPVPIKVWVSPGTYPIEAIVENLGTFEETGLTCYADLVEFISDPNGTVVYSDDIGNIDLDPLGDETTVTFTSYDFALEGAYGLFIDFPLANDDKMNNNDKSIGIGVDDTAPTAGHTLSPTNPNGLNGWYVSDVTVSLTADDDQATYGWQSGVDSIKYKVNGGATQTIPGDAGSFLITVANDGENVGVEYWSVDNVGNEEQPHKTFTVDMDQTPPEVDLSYEVTGGNQWQGWDITWTATATDATSGMDRVEFFVNDVLQETVTGAGPTYTWLIQYYPLPQVFFKATAYDIAGNFASDVVANPQSHPHSQQVTQTRTTLTK